MHKRGQLTIFIIIGVVIIFSVAGYLYIKSKVSEAPAKPVLTGSASAFNNYVVGCLEQTGKDAILFVGNQGGYYTLPDFRHNATQSLPYYLYQGKVLLPSKSDIESQLGRYVDRELILCIKNFVPFREQGYNVTYNKSITSVSIGKDTVTFITEMPLIFSLGQTTEKLEKFTADVRGSQIATILNLSAEIVNMHMDNETLCISCLYLLGIDNGIYIDVERVNDDDLLFTISDYNSPIANPFEWRFAVRQ